MRGRPRIDHDDVVASGIQLERRGQPERSPANDGDRTATCHAVSRAAGRIGTSSIVRRPGESAGASAEDAAYSIWSSQVRFLGVGAMLIGGVWTLISLRHSLVSGIRSGIRAERGNGGEAIPATERDLPMRFILIGLVIFVLPLMGCTRPLSATGW